MQPGFFWTQPGLLPTIPPRPHWGTYQRFRPRNQQPRDQIRGQQLQPRPPDHRRDRARCPQAPKCSRGGLWLGRHGLAARWGLQRCGGCTGGYCPCVRLCLSILITPFPTRAASTRGQVVIDGASLPGTLSRVLATATLSLDDVLLALPAGGDADVLVSSVSDLRAGLAVIHASLATSPSGTQQTPCI